MESAAAPLAGLVDALLARDFDRLAEVFSPDVRFSASLPRRVVEAVTAAGAVAEFRDWFGDADELQLLSSRDDRLGEATTFVYRLRAHKPRGWSIIEQAGACELAAGKVSAMRLACTGFQYEEAGASKEVDR